MFGDNTVRPIMGRDSAIVSPEAVLIGSPTNGDPTACGLIALTLLMLYLAILKFVSLKFSSTAK